MYGEFQVPGSALGADPAEALVDYVGGWAIRILLATLAISSVARVSRTPRLIQLRRMTGLWAFFYVVLHATCYLGLLVEFDLPTLVDDFVKRPYITVGITALLLLTPLAITSTRGWQRRLGPNWKKLHTLVYPAAIAAWIHVLWVAKASLLDAVLYGVVLAVLFAERIAGRIRRARGEGTQR